MIDAIRIEVISKENHGERYVWRGNIIFTGDGVSEQTPECDVGESISGIFDSLIISYIMNYRSSFSFAEYDYVISFDHANDPEMIVSTILNRHLEKFNISKVFLKTVLDGVAKEYNLDKNFVFCLPFNSILKKFLLQ
jgi:hypothetical protein